MTNPLPPKNCQKCPRLVAYRQANRAAHADWFNAPVPCFGDPQAALLIVGMAPGVSGANRTGRVFTGDAAGDLLYANLHQFGFSRGIYGRHIKDGLTLKNCMISNAVRCVPPKNKIIAAEAENCRPYLQARLASLPNLQIVLALGRLAHENVLRAQDIKLKAAPFAHGARHRLANFTLFNSYHCSRYNTNTGRLTAKMFADIFADIKATLN